MGSHLVAELLRRGGYEISLIARSEKSIEKVRAVCQYYGVDMGGVKIHYGELIEEDQVIGVLKEVEPDAVFHCAAVVSLGGVDGSELIRENVDLTESVTGAMVSYNSGAKRRATLIHVSSIAALGIKEGELTDEGCEITHIERLSPYSQSKYLSENVVWRASSLGVPTIIVNPSVIIGVSGDGTEVEGIQAFFKMVKRGLPFYTCGVIGFVDVRDVASAMIELLEGAEQGREGIIGQRFIVSGANLSYREVIGELSVAMGHKRPRLYVPKWLLVGALHSMSFCYRVVGKKSPIEPSMSHFMTSKTWYDNGKLLSVLPHFSYLSIVDTAAMVARRYFFKS